MRFFSGSPASVHTMLACPDGLLSFLLSFILGFSGSHFHTMMNALKQLGLGHVAINTLMLKLHEHPITCLHDIVTSQRKNNTDPNWETPSKVALSRLGSPLFCAMLTLDSLGVCMAFRLLLVVWRPLL